MKEHAQLKQAQSNEGALPFPTDLETNLFQRQLLTGGANEEEKPIGPGGNNFPKSEPPKGALSTRSAAVLSSAMKVYSSIVPAALFRAA
ncbi:MAG: hypothetical protein FRX49_07846 [Trebouxia sp. A1-2]|nr:MAG: hypothetical protein FRX49_07846 [Trebouxia sp. A1-2]